MPPQQPSLEEHALQLTGEFQAELANALNSLGGRQSRGLHDNYYVAITAHVNAAAEGFVLLRKEHRLDATKLLIRPAIEVVFRLEAVRRKPELLFRIAHTERLKDRSWFRRVATNSGQVFDERPSDEEWARFKSSYAAQCPSHALDESKISLFDLAAIVLVGVKTSEQYAK